MALAIGAAAPDVKLKDTSIQDVSLGASKGKENVVLLFFPFAFSSVCTEEMCGIRDAWADYSKLGAKIYGISIDAPFTLKAWKDAQKFPFELLSDFNKEAAKKYDVFYEKLGDWQGVAKRSAFVIGKDGKVAYSWVTDDPKVKPDMEAIKKAVASLK